VMFKLDVSVELMANVVDRLPITPRIEDRIDDGIIRIIMLYSYYLLSVYGVRY